MSSRMLLLFGIPVGMLATWSLVSPYFIDQRTPTKEPAPVILPLTQGETTPSTNQVNMQTVMSDAAAQPDNAVFEPIPIIEPAMEIPSVGRTGVFSGVDRVHRGSGTAMIYHGPNGNRWLRFENFRVTNGPDLVVYLTEHGKPEVAEAVTKGFVKLGQLKGNKGNQNYEIPEDLKLEDYGAVVIWCERFGVLFSVASLSDVET